MSSWLSALGGALGLRGAVSGPETYAGLWMLLALTAYSFLGAADFGGGVWDLLAGGPRAAEHRRLISRAMGPVWEANHVWLIFFLVVLFSAFPPVFAAISEAMFLPLHLVLAGIVLRGSAFVFRSYAPYESMASRVWARVFGAASIVTPFLLGAALAAVSTGAIRVQGGVVQADLTAALLGPFPLLVGFLTLALGAYLAAVYLTVEAPAGEVREDFRRRALWAGGAVALLAAALLPLMARTVPWLADRLLHPQALPLLLAGLLAATVAAWALWTRRFRLARFAAVAEVVTLLWGWSLAQWPYLIYPDVTLLNSAAPSQTLRFLLTLMPLGLVLLLPSLWLLFRVFKGENPAVPDASEKGADQGATERQ